MAHKEDVGCVPYSVAEQPGQQLARHPDLECLEDGRATGDTKPESRTSRAGSSPTLTPPRAAANTSLVRGEGGGAEGKAVAEGGKG